MNPVVAVGLAPFIPVLGAFFVWTSRNHPNIREGITLVTASLLFLVVLSVTPAVLSGLRPSLQLLELLPGLAIAFEVEPLGMLFALVASFLWIPNSIYSIGYMRARRESNQTRYYICFALSLASVIGLAFSANLVTMFLFYEALTLSTYPLVTHSGTPEARKAGRIYLGLLLGTSIGLQLIASIGTYVVSGTTDFRPGGILSGQAAPGTIAVLFALYMFGIGKAALMPFHQWLPAAMVAPTPVSALLHAVAVVKGGVFVVLKVVIYVFGIDLMQTSHPGEWLMWLAAFTILVASLIALNKDNLKARLAYSTVSQLSYIVLGAALASSTSMLGGGMHILTHAFGKITLFFCAGAIMITAHKQNISEMRGIGRAMPLTMLAFLIGAISVIGLPPFAGAWSKWYLIVGALEANQAFFVAVLMISSLLNIAYLLPVITTAFFPGKEPTEFDGPIREAPIACLVPTLLTAGGCLAIFIYPDPFRTLLLQLVTG